MNKEEWVAYILFEKFHFIFNREGRIYTGDLCEKRNEKKEIPIKSRFEILDIRK